MPAVAEAMASPMPLDAFLAEVGALVGELRLTLHQGHCHMSGPLSAADLRSLREECEDAPRPLTPMIVRCTLGQGATRHITVRNYGIIAAGVVRYPVTLVRFFQNTNSRTGADMGDEPGVTYE